VVKRNGPIGLSALSHKEEKMEKITTPSLCGPFGFFICNCTVLHRTIFPNIVPDSRCIPIGRPIQMRTYDIRRRIVPCNTQAI